MSTKQTPNGSVSGDLIKLTLRRPESNADD